MIVAQNPATAGHHPALCSPLCTWVFLAAVALVYLSWGHSWGHGPMDKSPQKSKHLKGRSVPPVRNGFASLKDFVVFLFLDTFRIQWPPLPYSRPFGAPCPERFWLTKDFVVFLFLESRHFPLVSGKSKTTKSPEVFKEFGQFSCF